MKHSGTIASARRVAALTAFAALAFCTGFAPPSAPGLPGLTVSAAAAAEPARNSAASRDAKSSARKKSRPARDTAFGREGDPRKVTRVIKVEMSDAMRYFPDHITVKKGQTVRFQVRNGGELPHEMVLGTMDDLKKHAAMMKKHGGAEHHDADEPNVAHVDPGGTGKIVWHFTRAGEFYFGCLVPGHFDAGMIGTIVVR